MKIERISRLKGHGIFHDFSWPSDLPDFKEKNLIYGWNGSGKTTLSELLRLLEICQPLDSSEGEVRFQIDGQVVSGEDIPQTPLPQVKVFNRNSIDRNILGVPGHQLRPIYFLGENSVEKEKRILLLKKQSEKLRSIYSDLITSAAQKRADVERFCTTKAREIKLLLTVSGGGQYNNYDAPRFRYTIQQTLKKDPLPPRLSKEKKEEYLAAKEGAPKLKIPLLQVKYPDFVTLTSKTDDLLNRSIVSATISDLLENPELANWVHEGLVFHAAEATECQFCGQPLPSERIHALEAHFNDRYNEFQKEISGQIRIIEDAIENISNISCHDKNLLYPHLIGEYSTAIDTFKQQAGIAKLYLSSLLSSLEMKKKEPFKILDLNGVLSDPEKNNEPSLLLGILQIIYPIAGAISTKLGYDALKKANEIITKHNQYTDDFSAKVDAAREALELDAVLESVSEYQKLVKAKEDAQENTDRVDQLKKQKDQKISALETEIKEHQKPADELNQELASYLGRDELKFEVLDNGYVITRNGQPADKLSEGERTAIAFMYFLKSLEDTNFDISSGVIVIDDPVSSLDANSLYSAFGFMASRTKEAGQLFILTHNFAFFRQVKNWFHHQPHQRSNNLDLRPARFYMIESEMINGNRRSYLKALDPLLEQYDSEYQYLFAKVVEYSKLATHSHDLEFYYGIPNMARRVLEAFLEFKRPNESGRLRDQLEKINFDSAKKTKILRFFHTHSHHGHIDDPEHDLSILSETPQILNDLLELIKEEDKRHYEEMLTLVGTGETSEDKAE